MPELLKLATIDGAWELFNKQFSPQLRVEKLPLMDCLNRVIAEDIISGVNVPNFARSTMDGLAVIARDTFGATEGMPAYLEIVGEVFMGQEAKEPIKPGTAIKISTGGMLPPGADAVVMVEYTEQLDDSTVAVLKQVAPGENIVRAGEDVGAGDRLVARGTLLRPQEIGALAGIGCTECQVYAKPKVTIISTGDEIVDPRQEPGIGQIRDINSYAIAALAANAGGQPYIYGIVEDTFEVLEKAISEALQGADIVVVSGGSSMGVRDVTARVINALGTPGVLVHGVSVKPGKPTILGVVEGKPVLGLPGHPVSAMALSEIFLVPLIRAYNGLGLTPVPRRTVSATLGRNLASASGRLDVVRVTLEHRENGLVAMPVLGKSGLITTMVKADGFIEIPMEKQGLAAGEPVQVKLY